MKKLLLFLAIATFPLTPFAASEIKDRPTLIIKTLDGQNFDLREKLGRVVIINFWASWCVDCRKEMLILDEIYRENQASGLEIIGVSIDRKRELKKVLQIAARASYPNSMLLDAKETGFETPNTIPLSYVINKEGRLTATLTGSGGKLDKKDFEEAIRPLF
jgi:thiol-disulfide isomerase/thioredoxin